MPDRWPAKISNSARRESVHPCFSIPPSRAHSAQNYWRVLFPGVLPLAFSDRDMHAATAVAVRFSPSNRWEKAVEPTPHAYPWAMLIEASYPLLPPSLFPSLQSGAPRDLCNCGYARGVATASRWRCRDAVRCLRHQPSDGHVRMIYVLEKNHAPGGHGVLRIASDESRALRRKSWTRQACAFFESYLKKVVAERNADRRRLKPSPKKLDLIHVLDVGFKHNRFGSPLSIHFQTGLVVPLDHAFERLSVLEHNGHSVLDCICFK